MAWHRIEGHDDVVDRFRRALGRGRLASSYLLVGPRGVGKCAFARRLAQVLLCRQREACQMDPCGQCDACRQVLAGTHPDLEYVSLPPGKKTIPVESFIGDRQHRGQAGLCHILAMKPFMGGRKVGIIDDADFLNEEGANCLLKTLEEPPPGSVLLLIGTSPDRQLPTIRSRCQIMRFRPLPESIVVDLLSQFAVTTDREAALRLARHCGGSLATATELASEDFWQFRDQFVERLGGPSLDTVGMARAVLAYVDGAGKEAADRRIRAIQVVGIAIDFYRGLLRAIVGPLHGEAADADKDNALGRAIATAAERDDGIDATGKDLIAARCIQRCLESLDHIDRNAHLLNVTACWLEDLARLNKL